MIDANTGPARWVIALRDAAARLLSWVAKRGVAIAVVAVAVLVPLAGKRLLFQFSAEAAVVDAFDRSSIYFDPGFAAEHDADRTELERIIGTRPLGVAFLSDGSTLAGRKQLDVCTTVADRQPQLMVLVIAPKGNMAGCQGDDVELGAHVDAFGWDYVFWSNMGNSMRLLDGDPVEQVRQFALAYDTEVTGGRVIAAERSHSPSTGRMLIAVVLVLAAAIGPIAAFYLIRWGSRWWGRRADLRNQWRRQRDEIDGRLGDIALRIVRAAPPTADGAADRFTAAIGSIAADYQEALSALADARNGDDLGPIDRAVHDIDGVLRRAENRKTRHRPAAASPTPTSTTRKADRTVAAAQARLKWWRPIRRRRDNSTR